MNQTRTISISARDLAMLITGSAIVLLLRAVSPETKAATPETMGLACGDWIIQTDQRGGGVADFDAFILNIKTGELLRTRSAGKELMTVVKK